MLKQFVITRHGVVCSDHKSPVLPQSMSVGGQFSDKLVIIVLCNDSVLNDVLYLYNQNSPHLFTCGT